MFHETNALHVLMLPVLHASVRMRGMSPVKRIHL